jgi:hypothetical protein
MAQAAVPFVLDMWALFGSWSFSSASILWVLGALEVLGCFLGFLGWQHRRFALNCKAASIDQKQKVPLGGTFCFWLKALVTQSPISHLVAALQQPLE